MIKSKEDLLNTFKTVVGEDASDEVLTLLEDMTDTISDLESKANGKINVKETAEYKELEDAWRKRYRDRFFADVDQSADDPDDTLDDHQQDNTPHRFEDLFTRS